VASGTPRLAARPDERLARGVVMLRSFFRALRDCVTGFMMLTTST
jgi:hypothetical protein